MNKNKYKQKLGRRNIWGNFRYSDLITKAIMTSKNKRLSLSEIYQWLKDNVPIFNDKEINEASWKNSVRHNLSLHQTFIKESSETEKGSYWKLNPVPALEPHGRRRSGSLESSQAKSRRSKNRACHQCSCSATAPHEPPQNSLQALQQTPSISQYSNHQQSTISHLQSIPSYHSSPAFRPAGNLYQISEYGHFEVSSNDSSSSGQQSPPAVLPDIIHNDGSNWATGYGRPRSDSYGESLSHAFNNQISIQPRFDNVHYYQIPEATNAHDNFPVQNVPSGGGYLPGMEEAIPPTASPMNQQQQRNNNTESSEFGDIQVDPLQSSTECNIQDIINLELNIDGILDFS